MYSLSTCNRVQALYMLSMEMCMLVMVPIHIACIPSHHVCAPLSLANRMWDHAKTDIVCIVTHAPYIYSIEPCMHSMVQYKNNTFALLSLKHAWMPLHSACMPLHQAHTPLSLTCMSAWHPCAPLRQNLTYIRWHLTCHTPCMCSIEPCVCSFDLCLQTFPLMPYGPCTIHALCWDLHVCHHDTMKGPYMWSIEP